MSTLEFKYNISELFEDFDFINLKEFAKIIDLEPRLMRKYVSDRKSPCELHFKKIIKGLYAISDKLESISLVMG